MRRFDKIDFSVADVGRDEMGCTLTVRGLYLGEPFETVLQINAVEVWYLRGEDEEPSQRLYDFEQLLPWVMRNDMGDELERAKAKAEYYGAW